MNLFVAGAHPPAELERATRALDAVLARVPLLPGAARAAWADTAGRAVIACAAHPGLRYWAFAPDRAALFAGRPILWRGEREADGATAIDPARHLDRADVDALDGRWAIVRCAGGALEVATDALGAYPVYAAGDWVSNCPGVLRELVAPAGPDLDALAGLLGGGWPLDGHPVHREVRRLAPGIHRWPERTHRPGLDRAAVARLPGAGLDVERAAAIVVAGVRALAQWPGRASVVPVTGGRDSRVVLAGAVAAGLDAPTATGGAPGSPDVEVGRALAAAVGRPHELLPPDPESMLPRWREAAPLLDVLTGGTATLADAAGFPMRPAPGLPGLWHSGQGGEIARAYYGVGDGLGRRRALGELARRFLARRPGRPGLLSREGAASVRAGIARWGDAWLAAGARPADLPDLFYLDRRMGTWAGPTHGCAEWVRDVTSPLWSRRLLPDLLGLPAAERAAEGFHRRVVARLAPALVPLPFDDGRRWTEPPPRARLPARLAGRLPARPAALVPRDPVFAQLVREVAPFVLDQPAHPAWAVLDRRRVERLLTGDGARLDFVRRQHVWRLATVFVPTA